MPDSLVPKKPVLTITQQQKDAEARRKIRRLFSEIPEEREVAIETLKECWGYHKPNFRFEELATMHPDACSLVAAQRDGHKEIIDWLSSLSIQH